MEFPFQEERARLSAETAEAAERVAKATARRNRLLGGWAAHEMKLTPEETDAYATALVHADMEGGGDDEPFVPEEEEEGAEVFGDGGSRLTQGDGLMMARARRSPNRPSLGF